MEWLEYISFDSFPSFCCAYIGDKWRAHATDDDGWPSTPLYVLEIFFLFGREREVGKFCESTKESISRCRKYGRPIVFRAVDTGQQIICLFVSPSWPCISIVKSFYYSRDDAFWPGLTLSSILNRAHSRRESEEKKKKRSSFRPSERERESWRDVCTVRLIRRAFESVGKYWTSTVGCLNTARICTRAYIRPWREEEERYTKLKRRTSSFIHIWCQRGLIDAASPLPNTRASVLSLLNATRQRESRPAARRENALETVANLDGVSVLLVKLMHSLPPSLTPPTSILFLNGLIIMERGRCAAINKYDRHSVLENKTKKSRRKKEEEKRNKNFSFKRLVNSTVVILGGCRIFSARR